MATFLKFQTESPPHLFNNVVFIDILLAFLQKTHILAIL